MTAKPMSESTLTEAVNLNLASQSTTELAWRQVVTLISEANLCTKKMNLLNVESDEESWKAQLVVELSDAHMATTNLSYDAKEETLVVVSELVLSSDGHGLMSCSWKTVEEGHERRFHGDYTLADIADSILSSNTEMAYEALNRANRTLFPMPPSVEMLRKLEQSI